MMVARKDKDILPPLITTEIKAGMQSRNPHIILTVLLPALIFVALSIDISSANNIEFEHPGFNRSLETLNRQLALRDWDAAAENCLEIVNKYSGSVCPAGEAFYGSALNKMAVKMETMPPETRRLLGRSLDDILKNKSLKIGKGEGLRDCARMAVSMFPSKKVAEALKAITDSYHENGDWHSALTFHKLFVKIISVMELPPSERLLSRLWYYQAYEGMSRELAWIKPIIVKWFGSADVTWRGENVSAEEFYRHLEERPAKFIIKADENKNSIQPDRAWFNKKTRTLRIDKYSRHKNLNITGTAILPQIDDRYLYLPLPNSICCFNLSSGFKKWHFTLEGEYGNKYTLDQNTAYRCLMLGDKVVSNLEVPNQIWSSTDARRPVFLPRRNYYAIDRAHGRLLWEARDTRSPRHSRIYESISFNQLPVKYGSFLYAVGYQILSQVVRFHLYCFSMESGEVAWDLPLYFSHIEHIRNEGGVIREPSYSTLFREGSTLYFCTYAGMFYAIDLLAQRVLWVRTYVPQWTKEYNTGIIVRRANLRWHSTHWRYFEPVQIGYNIIFTPPCDYSLYILDIERGTYKQIPTKPQKAGCLTKIGNTDKLFFVSKRPIKTPVAGITMKNLNIDLSGRPAPSKKYTYFSVNNSIVEYNRAGKVTRRYEDCPSGSIFLGKRYSVVVSNSKIVVFRNFVGR
ncbi:hypothetical protein ACFL54_05560 [Planctomycetota bacterium]